MKDSDYFDNKTVLITGAAGGIGWLLANHISQYECELILIDINLERLESTKSRFENRAAKINIFQADLSQENDLEKICHEFQSIDILINNAGIVSGAPIHELTSEQIRKTFEINTIAPMILTKHFLKDMIESNSGHIVNIASASAYTGVAKLGDYAASKAAMTSFDESLRFEIQNQGLNIKTTMIAPFYMNTGMFKGVKSKFSFILPILKPETCADKMIDAITSQKSRLIMPRATYLIFLVRMLPLKLADKVLHFLGVNKSMEDFIGRQSSKSL